MTCFTASEQRVRSRDLDPVNRGPGFGLARQIAVLPVGPHDHLGAHEPVPAEHALHRIGLLARGEAARVIAPLALVVYQIGERVGSPECRHGTLGVERSQQDTVDRTAPTVKPGTYGNGYFL